MSSPEQALEVLKTVLAKGQLRGDAERIEPTMIDVMAGTIAPTVNAKGTSSDRARQMLTRAIEKRADRLTLGDVLGEGGMGIVRCAKQADLGRTVAVKTLRNEITTDDATVAMLREAWVTGTLEHPNIVPVYYVDSDEAGRPLIVLKRIEGTVWSALMSQEEEVKERFGATDLLEWNLSVLEKVINAMRYAHQRGVVHRDLKPDNVMLGEFGEVYVLDWGIAVGLVDDGETLLPMASETFEMAGTPAFMAPEMLGDPVDQRTDVYLLGALLYQVMADRPPHIGENLEGIIDSILASAPVFPKGSPKGLREICRKAMAVRAEDRYQSARELGVALREFRGHRGSLRLSARALKNLRRLRELVAQGAQSDAIVELLGECRFGFQSSLEAWRGNPEALNGLCDAVELVARYELTRGDPRLAASILRELEAPSTELAEEIDSKVKEVEASDERLARMGQQLDTRVGQRTRVLMLSLMGTSWLGVELWAQLTGSVERYATHQEHAHRLSESLTIALSPHIEYAVITGIVLAVGVHMWREQYFSVSVEYQAPTLTLRPDGVIWFASTPNFREHLAKAVHDHPEADRLIIDLERVGRVDLSGAMALREVALAALSHDMTPCFVGISPNAWRIMRKVCGPVCQLEAAPVVDPSKVAVDGS